MQLKVRHRVKNPLVLPISYNYILQSAIYNAMRSDYGLNRFVHDKGFVNNNKTYKMFTFSMLSGKYKIENKKITFFEEVSFEIRSTEAVLLKNIKDNLEAKGITYLSQHFEVDEVKLCDVEVEDDEVMIKMRTPICLHETYEVDGASKTRFFTPEDEEFARKLNENFVNKYESYTQNKPKWNVDISPVMVTPRDKVVTKYKGIYISGYKGIYKLKGERKYLDFLYQVGMGEKNAQGFGMFDVIDEK